MLRAGLLRIVLGAAAMSAVAALAFVEPSAAAKSAPIGDTCLIGRWIEQSYSAPGNWTWPEAGGPSGPPVIPATGLAGLVITYSADGTETADYSSAQPVIGDYQGHQLKVVIRGVVSIGVHADGQQIAVTTAAGGGLTSTWYVDGVLYPLGTVTIGSGTSSYTCSSTRLHIESPALHPGYGPELDDLVRANVATPSQGQSLISTVGSTLPTPQTLLKAPLALLANALLTLALVLLVTFPSHLFNRTLEENYDSIKKWWDRRLPRFDRLRGRFHILSLPRRPEAGYAVVVLAGGVLAALLDPRFGPNLRTLALFAGAVFALTAGSLVAGAAAGVYRLTQHRAEGLHLYGLPGGLLVAAVCVLISRLVSFQPGYLYGLIGGVVFARSMSPRQEGHVVAITSTVTLVISFAAWLLWVPVSTTSAAHPADFGWALLSNFLAALFVSGIVGLVLGLVPLRFLPGEKLARWNRAAWGAVFGVASLALLEVMLRPQSSGAHVASVPFWTTASLFVAFGAASVTFWGYFRVRASSRRP